MGFAGTEITLEKKTAAMIFDQGIGQHRKMSADFFGEHETFSNPKVSGFGLFQADDRLNRRNFDQVTDAQIIGIISKSLSSSSYLLSFFSRP